MAYIRRFSLDTLCMKESGFKKPNAINSNQKKKLLLSVQNKCFKRHFVIANLEFCFLELLTFYSLCYKHKVFKTLNKQTLHTITFIWNITNVLNIKQKKSFLIICMIPNKNSLWLMYPKMFKKMYGISWKINKWFI